MATSKQDIKRWLDWGKDKGYSHMVVICDQWDYEDYTKYVKMGDDVTEVIKSCTYENMQKVMEVYNYGMDLEYQLNQGRAYNIDIPEEKQNNDIVKTLH